MEKNETHANGIGSHDCVSSDTRIVLMDPNGRVIYTTASYFKRLGIGTAKLCGWKILSTDGKFTDLIKVSMWESDHINMIRASHGAIKITDNQIIPIYRKKKYMEIPAKDINKYDCLIEVPLKNIIKEEDKLQEINLIDILPTHSNVLIVGTPKLATFITNITPNIPIKYKIEFLEGKRIPFIDLDYYRSIRKELADVIDEDELCLIFKRTIGIMKPIPAKYKLTREFGRFYGLFYSEGCVGCDDNIYITNTDSEIIDFAKTYLAKLLHRDKVNINVKTNGCSDVRLGSVLFALLLKNNILGFHHGSGNLKLPNWFFFANDDFLKGFLSGVIDGDGCISVSDIRTTIITSSETFAEDIQTIYSRLGYIASVSVERRKGTIARFKDKSYTRNFDRWIVRISNSDIVDMDLHDSIKARKLNRYNKRKCDRTYRNLVWSIDKCNFNDCVFGFGTSNHYFAAGTQLLHDCR